MQNTRERAHISYKIKITIIVIIFLPFYSFILKLRKEIFHFIRHEMGWVHFHYGNNDLMLLTSCCGVMHLKKNLKILLHSILKFLKARRIKKFKLIDYRLQKWLRDFTQGLNVSILHFLSPHSVNEVIMNGENIADFFFLGICARVICQKFKFLISPPTQKMS